MGTHPIFESDFDCLTERLTIIVKMLRSLARPVQMTVSRRPLSVGQFWKSLPGLEKVFFISAGSGVLIAPYLIAKGEPEADGAGGVVVKKALMPSLIQITSYLLVPPTQCLF